MVTDLRALDAVLAARLGARGASISTDAIEGEQRALSPAQIVASLILQRSERKTSRKKRRAMYAEAEARAEGIAVDRRPSPLRTVMTCEGEEESVDGVMEDVEMDVEC